MSKYFLVTCHRGHCGTKRSTAITFAFRAQNLLEAASMAKKMPSVKHTRGIIGGHEIPEEEYFQFRSRSAYSRAGY